MTKSNNSQSILELSHIEAQKYFLKNENYCNFDLPEYFNFECIIEYFVKRLENSELSDFTNKIGPSKFENVNHTLLFNKDGRFSWRPFQLINPALYVSLVKTITKKDHWQFIQKRFDTLSRNKELECISIPRQSNSQYSNLAEQVINWCHEVEQRSIELALDYKILSHTDITDCYSSIYTHSIPWALHGKTTAKNKKNLKSLLGNKIDTHLQDMNFGQTNGIPQGSSLMDFVAEIILCYCDLLLTDCLKELKVTDYHILRYRDDYRIFTNSVNDSETIIKSLSEILVSVGLKINPNKTVISNNVIRSSLKEDKLYFLKQRFDNKSHQLHLL